MATLPRRSRPASKLRSELRAGRIPTARREAALALGALLLASTLLRSTALNTGYWIDEGLTVGISSFSPFEIPSVLRQDGSPPLYYLLLHGWMAFFGPGEVGTHSLGLVIAMLSVGAALWAGWTLSGPPAGWACAVLAAVIPYMTDYAQETRMYALLALGSILVTATFVGAFVLGRPRFVLGFAAALTLMLYTHNWSLYVVGATGLALIVCLLSFPLERRKLVRDAVLGFGLPGLLYLPWVPTLIFQVRHTGAPWSEHPSFRWLFEGILRLMGGEGPAVALLLAGGAGAVAMLGREATRRERLVLLAPLLIGIATALIAWGVAQLEAAWSYRYLAVLIGPLLVPAGIALGRAGRYGGAGLAVIVVMWATTLAPEFKSNVRYVAPQVNPLLEPGDLVISTQPEQVPVIARYFEPGLRYASTLGPVTETRVMDWRDVLDRLDTATPERNLEPMLDDLGVGTRVAIVRPIIRGASWRAPWTHLVRERSAEWAAALAGDRRFRKVAVAPVTRAVPSGRPGIRAVIYRKTRMLKPR